MCGKCVWPIRHTYLAEDLSRGDPEFKSIFRSKSPLSPSSDELLTQKIGRFAVFCVSSLVSILSVLSQFWVLSTANNMKVWSLKEAPTPSKGYSAYFNAEKPKSNEMESSLKALKDSIYTEFSPSLTELPFAPRFVIPLEAGSLFLVSAPGKVCYYPDVNASVKDIHHVINEEIWRAALIDEDDLVVVTVSRQIKRVDLKSMAMTFQFDNVERYTKELMTQGSTYFVLSQKDLMIFSSENNEYKTFTFWNGEPIKLATNNEYVVVLTDSGEVMVFNWKKEQVVQEIDIEFIPLNIAISQNLVAVIFSNEIEIYPLETDELISKRYTQIDDILAVSFSPSEQFLAACTKKGYVLIWDVRKATLDPQVFMPPFEDPKHIGFIDEITVFVQSDKEDKLGIVMMHEFRNHFSVPSDKIGYSSEENKVKDIIYLEQGNSLLFTIQNEGLRLFKADDLSYKTQHLSEMEVHCTVNKSKSLIYMTESQTGRKYINKTILTSEHLETYSSSRISGGTDEKCASALVTRKKYSQIMYLFKTGSCFIMSEDNRVISDTTIHKTKPTVMVCFNSGMGTISGDIDGNVFEFSLETFSRNGIYQKHSAPISAIEISMNDELVICASSDGVIRISEVQSKSCIYSIKNMKYCFTKLQLTLDMQYLMGSSQKEKVFCIWDFSKRIVIAKKEGAHNFLLFKDDTKLVLCLEDECKLIEQPLTPENIAAIGSSSYYIDYFTYISNILDRKYPEYRPEFNDHLILPYKINVVHLYAYFNSNMLKRALASECLIVQSSEGKTPLSICLSSQSSLMNEVLDYLINQMAINPGYAYFFEGLLSDINRQGSVHIEKLYDTLFQTLNLKQLPEFCSKEDTLPVVIETKNTYNLSYEEFFGKSLFSFDTPIQFNQLTVRMNYFQGSAENINFIESILDCPNEEVFRSAFISMLLNYKWKQDRWIMFLQGSVYLAYLVLLIVYVSYTNSTTMLTILLLASILLTVYEMLQMVTLGLEYFKSLLNIADTLRWSLFLIYAGIVLMESENEYTTGLRSIVVLISFIRGISFFSLFEPTRYMATLVFEVFKDLVAFGIILAYTIVAIATLNISLINEDYNQDFFGLLLESFTLSLGDFDLGEFDVYQKFMFLAAAIINMIVMLNLLISILGDTFDRVQQGRMEANGRAIAEMILEVEKLLFWKRKKGEQTFFTVCTQQGVTDADGSHWEGKIRSILNSITDTKHSIASDNDATRKLIIKNQKDLVTDIAAVINESMQKEFDQMKTTINSLSESVAQIKSSLGNSNPISD